MNLLLLARADKSGLGFQTKALYDLLRPQKTVVIDSTPFNGREQYFDWYPNAKVNNGLLTNQQIRRYLRGVDVVLSCEVFYNDRFPEIARAMGVKTILQPNAELNPHILNRRLPLPDMFVLPSPWLEDESRGVGVPTVIIKPPIIQPRLYKYIPKERGVLKVLHFGGRRAAHDRNGTEIVRNLGHIDGVYVDIHDQGTSEVQDQRDLYEKDYHVVLIPRRYGGLCLPMLESLSYGIPVIMPNIEPNRRELPSEWLTLASGGKRIRTKNIIDTYEPDTQSIIWMLEKFRDMSQLEYNKEREKANVLYKAHQDQLSKWKELIWK